MFKRATLICAALLAVNAQPPNPFFSGGPPSSPFGGNGRPPASSPFGGGGPLASLFGKGGPPSSSHFSIGGPSSSSPFSSGGPPSSSPFSSGGPPSSSPFSSGGPPSSSPFGGGGPPFSNGPPGRPGNRPKNSPGNKLFNWLGSTMSKLQGLGPKISYYPPKSKPSSIGGPSSSGPNAPPSYFSSGGPPRQQSLILPEVPNSLFEGSSSPYNGGSTVTFSSPSHSNSIDHPPVLYRNPSGPQRPGPPPPRFGPPRPAFGSRPPPSFSPGGSPPYSSSPYASSRPPFGGQSFSTSQNSQNNLEVFPSQQISYQSQTLSQNQPGYNNANSAFGSLQSLYGSQSNSQPSYFSNQQGPSNYQQQQSSYSQSQPQVSKSPENNYGATFHSVEPVQVAPMYDVGQNFKASSGDLSGAASQQNQRQQQSNIHDTPFASIVNEYAAQADAATAGSEQMISALQGASDLATAASTNQAIPGMQIMGQNQADGNPIFEVVADANAPTYDGHPVDLNRLISMIEPGAQIDTMPSYNSDTDMGSSEQQPVYAQAPSHLELESDAAMASGIMSGNKHVAVKKSHASLYNPKIKFNNINDKLKAVASESRPTVVKLDGTRLNDEKLIKEHFDKEIILDDLQENKDHGFIIVGVPTDNDTGDQDEDEHLLGTNKNWTMLDSFHSSNNNKNNENDDNMLAIVQQLRNSASVVVNSFKNDSKSFIVTSPSTPNNTTDINNEDQTNARQHPNHNYYPELAPKVALQKGNEHESETRVLPVINPIFDSVRPSNISTVDDDINSSTSLETKTDIDHDDVQLIADNVDDDDQFYPDDMIMGTDGDLAASGSRNVKSVAIIVTPPPNYVKIRNKYKKTITPLSAMTSTTPLSTTSELGNLLPPTTPSSRINESFSESLKSNNFSRGIENNEESKNIREKGSSISATTIAVDSSLPSNLANSSSRNNDSILNDSTIRSGFDIVDPFRQYESRNRTLMQKQPRRYPVYRGKSSNA